MNVVDISFVRSNPFEDDILYAATVFLPTNYGIKRTRITVLNRMTGFGHRDIETGFRDVDGRFWLASCEFDIRYFSDLTEQDAVNLIKKESNNCKGDIAKKCFDIATREQIG